MSYGTYSELYSRVCVLALAGETATLGLRRRVYEESKSDVPHILRRIMSNAR